MLKYHLDIYWSETDNAFIAAVPELPGCMADGATYEEVVKNVQVIIQQWIEVATEFNRPIPSPVYGCISGKGLHTGKQCIVTLKPAEENTGILFKRIDLDNSIEIPADCDLVADVRRGTTLEMNKIKILELIIKAILVKKIII